MKALLLLFVAVSTVLPNDRLDNLMKVRQEMIEQKTAEINKKTLDELRKMERQASAGNLSKNIQDLQLIQREIWKLQILGKYHSENNKNFLINILDNGVAVQPGVTTGTWKIADQDGKYVYRIYLGDWSFTIPVHDGKSNGDFPGTIHFKNGAGSNDGLIKK